MANLNKSIIVLDALVDTKNRKQVEAAIRKLVKPLFDENKVIAFVISSSEVPDITPSKLEHEAKVVAAEPSIPEPDKVREKVIAESVVTQPEPLAL